MPVVVTRARETLGPRVALLERCEQQIRELGRQVSLRGFVPGRIEVLGKHVDYAGGRSIVCAIDRGIAFAASLREDAVLRAIDVAREEAREAALDIGTVSTADWATYIAALARRVARDFPTTLNGVDVAIASDLPSASGLSSSSALLIAAFLALAGANAWFDDTELGSALRSSPATALAEYLAAVESGRSYGSLAADEGVGTLGGSQDHTAILCAVRDRLSRFEFLPTRHLGDVELPTPLSFAVAYSGVHAAKTAAARDSYNRASLAVSEIVRIWQEQTRNRTIKSLRRAIEARGVAGVRAAIRMSESNDFSAAELISRLDHFVSEMKLHDAAASALTQQDWRTFGDLVSESQRGAEQLLGNQVPQTIELVRLAVAEGALAASAFGAGFGGSVWALVETGSAERMTDRWREAYASIYPDDASGSTFFVTRPRDAAHYIA